MLTFEFYITPYLTYREAGKLATPTLDFVHPKSPLKDYELFAVTEGTLFISYNDKNYAVKAGEFLLLPPMPAPHNIRCGYKESKCIFYWFHFMPPDGARICQVSPETLADYLTGLAETRVAIPQMGTIPNRERLIILMKQLQDAAKNHYTPITLNHMASVVILELFNQLIQHPESYLHNKKNAQLHQDILTYIQLNIDKNLKVSDIAEVFGYNSKYISNLFLTHYGYSLKQHILACKMDYASYLLTDTTKSIKEIAGILGFPDSHNFTRTYKKMSGLSPTDYRNAFSKRHLNYH